MAVLLVRGLLPLRLLQVSAVRLFAAAVVVALVVRTLQLPRLLRAVLAVLRVFTRLAVVARLALMEQVLPLALLVLPVTRLRAVPVVVVVARRLPHRLTGLLVG